MNCSHCGVKSGRLFTLYISGVEYSGVCRKCGTELFKTARPKVTEKSVELKMDLAEENKNVKSE